MARIAVIGVGYVGLTTGACLAHRGHRVTAADVVAEKIAALNAGRIPILEEGLDELVTEGRNNGRLRFVVGAPAAIPHAEFVFLCLPTPQGLDGSADLSFVEAAAIEIAPLLEPGAVVINKSTVPVGSVELVADILGRPDVAVVSNPEFLREGTAVDDCLHPDRIVIGGPDRDAVERVARLFDGLETALVLTDAASAETIKYASNAFLATKVSYINGVANLCEAVGADIEDVVQGMGLDPRIGFEFLQPGPGWGGSCLPKDTRAMVRIGEDFGYDFALLRGVIDANQAQQDLVVHKIERMAGGSLRGVTVAAWGLAFKAGTDDIRDSPAISLLRRLTDAGAAVRAFDPAVRRPLPPIETIGDPYEACAGADVLTVLTEWPLFARLDLSEVQRRMATPRIVDARNILDAAEAAAVGFAYDGIGRRGWIELREIHALEARNLEDSATRQ
jgi:UDPglucose 6-dehydrogenase